MRDDGPACAGVVATPMMTVPPVIVVVAGAIAHAEIFRLCGSRRIDGGKTDNGGSDCDILHAYPPIASCLCETKRFRAHSVPQFDFVNATQRAASRCVNSRAVESPLRRRRARPKGRAG